MNLSKKSEIKKTSQFSKQKKFQIIRSVYLKPNRKLNQCWQVWTKFFWSRGPLLTVLISIFLWWPLLKSKKKQMLRLFLRNKLLKRLIKFLKILWFKGTIYNKCLFCSHFQSASLKSNKWWTLIHLFTSKIFSIKAVFSFFRIYHSLNKLRIFKWQKNKQHRNYLKRDIQANKNKSKTKCFKCG